jgi:MFS transporter, DHA2 family, multidrug resistance protein
VAFLACEHGPGARLFDPQGAALAVLNKRISAQALLRSFNNSFILLALALLAASWVIALMRRPQQGSAVDAGAH